MTEFTDEQVEPVARAMNLEAGRQRGLAFEDDWNTITEQEKGGWRLMAHAALSAAAGVGEPEGASVGVDDIREQIAKIIWNNSASGREGAHDLACLITDRVVVPLIERDTAVRLLREAQFRVPRAGNTSVLHGQIGAFLKSLDGPDDPDFVDEMEAELAARAPVPEAVTDGMSDRERVADYLASAHGVEFQDLNADAQCEWLRRASDALRAVWSIGRLAEVRDESAKREL